MGHYGSKSCMNPNVSWIHPNDTFSRSISSISGFVEGGELVTVRATEVVKGMVKHSAHGPIAEPVAREVEEFQIQHP